MTKNEAAMTVSLTYADALTAIRKAQSLTETTGEQWKADQPVAGVHRFIVSRA